MSTNYKKSRGCNNVFQIGERKNSNSLLYKYMNVERAISFLSTGKYYLVEPTAWPDPYEKRFYTADYTKVAAQYNPQQIYCTCFTDKISNEAAWKMYRGKDDGIANRSIRFEMNRTALLQYLDHCIDNKGKIYIGDANYRYTSKQIDDLHKRQSKLYSEYFHEFSESKFLELLLIKRKAFEYESEVRLFYVPIRQNEIYFNDKLYAIHSCLIEFTETYLRKIIKSISIDPSCSQIECEMIKSKIETICPWCECKPNGLYKKKPRIIIGK